jgi:hypothetical protein
VSCLSRLLERQARGWGCSFKRREICKGESRGDVEASTQPLFEFLLLSKEGDEENPLSGLCSCFPYDNLVIICLQASEGTSKEVIKSGSKEAKEAAAKGSKKKVVKKKGGVSKPWWTQNEGPLPWEMAAAGIALALLLMFFFVVRPSASGLCFGRAAGDLLVLGAVQYASTHVRNTFHCWHHSCYSCLWRFLLGKRKRGDLQR